MNARARAVVVAGAVALATCAPTGAFAAPATVVTPALGGTAWTSEGVAKLAADLDALLGDAPALRGAHVGVVALNTASGDMLYARNAGDEFQPASTLKLVVGSAALDRLGPQYRFHTSLVAQGDGSPKRLVFRAGGDPLLAKADLDDGVRAVLASGFTSPRDDLTIDDSRYDRAPYPAGWTWDDFAYDYAPRISAVTFEENVVHVAVGPGARVGALARIGTAPLDAVRFAGEGCSPTASVVVRPRAKTAPAASDSDALDIVREPGGCIDIVGSIPLGSPPQTIDAAVPSPALYAYDYLRGGLKSVLGPSATRVASFPDEHRYEARQLATRAPGTVLWQHDSPPLATFLGPRFWIPSDNLVGEVLLKELGLVTGALPGTTEKGVAYEKVWLRSIGVDPATVTLADGCGMSQYDRITPRDLVAVLQHDWNGPNRQLVLASLPVGGARGTIEGIADTPAAGRVFAKTGSMMHVRGLAGFLATIRHGAVTFAFEVDDWNGDYPALAALRARVLARLVVD